MLELTGSVMQLAHPSGAIQLLHGRACRRRRSSKVSLSPLWLCSRGRLLNGRLSSSLDLDLLLRLPCRGLLRQRDGQHIPLEASLDLGIDICRHTMLVASLPTVE